MDRTFLKKIIYKLFGENTYRKAYSKGKILDIKKGKITEPETKFLHHFLKKNSIALDIGANYGHYTYLLSKITKNKIYAFEPIPFTYQVLENVTNEFKLDNVILFNSGASNENGEIQMTLPALPSGAPNTGIAFIGKSADIDSKIVEVKMLKIDELNIEGPVDFIKIDIEGHEPEAFIGMEILLKKNKPTVLIEFSHNCMKRAGKSPVEFAAYLNKKMNFQFYYVENEKLKMVTEKVPKDGYYFLIEKSRVNDFASIISE